MDEQLKIKISEGFNKWLEENPTDRKVKAFARDNNLNEAYVSFVKNGIYSVPNKKGGKDTVIADQYFYRIAEAIGLMHRSHTGAHWETNNFKEISRMCKRAQNKRMRYLLDGDTGHGKTYALDYFQIHADKTIYIKVTRTMTERNLLEAILKKLGHRDFPRGNREKINAINYALTGHPGFLLIIDEAEYLRASLYHVIKEIADFTENKCGFVLAGFQLVEKINKLAIKKREGFPQLKRRFFPNRMMLPNRIENTEKRMICDASDITEKTAINVICEYCNDFDMLSQVVGDVIAWQNSNSRKMTGNEIMVMFKDSFDL